MRICCIVSSMGGGGSERVMATLTAEWAARSHLVTLITLSGRGSDRYELDPRVVRRSLDALHESSTLARSVVANAKRLYCLRRAVATSAPDIIVSFGDKTNVLAVMATVGLRVPVIASERTYPPCWPIGSIWSSLRHASYRYLDELVVQTQRSREWASTVVAPSRVTVIANPLSPQFVDSSPLDHSVRRPWIVTCGRLVRSKRVDLIITAFDILHRQSPNWRLLIVGDGPERERLVRLAEASQAAGQIEFTGEVTHPEAWLRQAAVAAFAPQFEGFPNALIEAMSSGCAVVVTDCPTGPAEIIDDGITGVLVPVDDTIAFSEALKKLARDQSYRQRVGAAAVYSSRRYRSDIIAGEWESLFHRVAGRRRTPRPVRSRLGK